MYSIRCMAFTGRWRPAMTAAWSLILSVLLAGAPVHAQSPAASQAADDPAHGQRLFERQCARCHGIQGAGSTGPALNHSGLRRAAGDSTLFAVVRDGIPGTEMPGAWQMTDREIWQTVRYVQSLGQMAVVPLPGDIERGKALYADGDCAKCHTVRGQGGSLGPDLTDAGARRSPAYFRTILLKPGTSKPSNPAGYTAFAVVSVVTRDNRTVRGMRLNEDTFTIQLRDADNRTHSFRKREVKELNRAFNESLMPGYDEAFSAPEIDDLIAYLVSLRGER